MVGGGISLQAYTVGPPPIPSVPPSVLSCVCMCACAAVCAGSGCAMQRFFLVRTGMDFKGTTLGGNVSTFGV